MSDFDVQLRDDLHALAGQVSIPPMPLEVPHRAGRRRAAKRASVATACLVVVTASTALVAVAMGTFSQSPALQVATSPPAPSATFMATSPLSPRQDPSSAWTGSELFVWGGSHDGTYLDDGALYNPATNTWRTLPQSPLSPRSGAGAAWTGTEVVVWSGENNASRTPTGLVDGAAYDPTTNAWHRIAAAPGTGRHDFVGFSVGGQVMFAGGIGPQDVPSARRVLTYHPATDTWTATLLPTPVYDATPTSDGLVTTGVDPTTNAVESHLVGPDGAVKPLALNYTGTASGVGVVANAQAPLLIVSAHDATSKIFKLDSGTGAWQLTGTSGDLPASVDVGTLFRAATGQGRYGPFLVNSAGAWRISAGGAQRIADPLFRQLHYCGVGSAHAWSGSELLLWGGQSCVTPGASTTGAGVIIRGL